jgi:hypothetical protein
MQAISKLIARVGIYIGVATFFVVLVIVKIPTSFNNFWAEDGTFYQQALTEPFPRDMFSSGVGYIILISRIIARIVTLGPISYAPFVNEIVVTLLLSFFVIRLYTNLDFFIKSRVFKVIISLSVFLLPITSFDVIASGGGIHFQMIFISLVIVLTARQRAEIYKLDVLIIVIAILSDPLAVITLAPLFIRIRNEALIFWNKKLTTLAVIAAAGVLQFIMVVKSYSKGSRTISDDNSMTKTSYLFLDRVIGSTFVPHWGRVSSDTLLAGGITIQLIIRAFIGLAIIAIILFFSAAHLRRNLPINELHSKATISWLIVLPIIYWFTVGYLFNPEPRYAIFPGLSFLLVALILLDHALCSDRIKLQFRLLTCLVLFFSILIWVFSPSPSDRRVIGPEWSSQITNGKLQCAKLNQESVIISILPMDTGWEVKIPCKFLVN